MVLNIVMKKSNTKGFTLMELMVLLGIVGVVTSIALPSFNSLMLDSELVDVSNSLRMSMKLARNEAVTQGKNTIICSSTDGATCSFANNNWVKGWIVGVDINGNNNIDGTDELLWVNMLDGNTPILITPTDSAFNQSITYNYSGWLDNLSANATAGFDICSGAGSEPRRELRASIAGDPRVTRSQSVKC